ncbi:hypothetical protein GPECTOR_11g84 [Gonium pectorale]|uniref:FAD-binding PCMH-type domain-containing protein n=1 Tax=Gonium pectorale TaxID=33097 RepID=A0A150GQ81_GONPE|nr:hypothetical protein GPECTOR_11g84 [Gonium pectorale]|eukprot:KXZ51961.1 hypothetical protein GPECTOR_11g84 [Gonium pectorale]
MAWCGTGSLADIEDLGQALGAPAAAAATAATPPADEELALGNGQLLKVPKSLESLLAEAACLAASDASSAPAGPGRGGSAASWRLVAGNTGHGVFKDWPASESVLLSVTEVPELLELKLVEASYGPPGRPQLLIGAGVTLEQLAARLERLAAGEAGAEAAVGGGGAAAVRQWAAETCAHLRRIAGRHVRNSATVGGNLALTAERGLPSDVATLLGAAGAEVELRLVSTDAATHGSLVRADLMAFLASGAAAAADGQASGAVVPPGCAYILTAVRVPLPSGPEARFWSQRVAERYSNAAAIANAAISVTLAAGDHGGGGAVVAAVRIVVGVRTPPAGPVLQHNAAKSADAAALLLDGWRCFRAVAAEAALLGKPATTASVAAALAAAELTAVAAGTAATVAEGLVAQGLMACLGLAPPTAGADGADSNGDMAAAAPLSRLPPPSLVNGSQVYPDPVPELEPVTHPVPKYGSKLQASGTALYTEDTPVHDGALYGAFVLASRAGAVLAGLDASPALALPGVVRCISAADLSSLDLSAAGSSGVVNRHDAAVGMGGTVPEPVFLDTGSVVGFAGQAVGLVLATSPWAAQRGAKAVAVQYDADSVPAPVMSIQDAVRAGSFYPLGALLAPMGMAKGGSYGGTSVIAAAGGPAGGAAVDAALAAAGAPSAAAAAAAALGAPAPATPAAPAETEAIPSAATGGAVRVVSGRYGTPSQLHFYMETQSAVAWPDEDGCVVVHSSCQGTDMIQAAVATMLGLPLNKVIARCRRVGGGFGGKATLARRVAAAAASAAVITRRQVRLQVPRNDDFVMNGGRCDGDVSYVAVVREEAPAGSDAADEGGATRGSTNRLRLSALDLHVVLRGGAYMDIAWLDAMGMLNAITGLYDIPAFRAEVALARCNLPPRTAVRAPGEAVGTLIIEQIMEHVAAELGVDPETFRQDNFLSAPKPQPEPEPAAPEATPAPTSAVQGTSEEQATVSKKGDAAAGQESSKPVVTAVSEPAKPAPQASADAAPVTPPPQLPPIRMPLGKLIPARMFTLPVLWEKLQRQADWEGIKAEVAAFNAANPWHKRGVAMLPARYGMYRGRKPAYVSLLADGSVQVATHGIEMGQGLFTKVAQCVKLGGAG